MKRKLTIMFGLLLVMGATLSIGVGPALSSPHSVLPEYLALGDSLAVGVGATVPSQTGYVAKFDKSYFQASQIGPDVLTNLGVAIPGGETSGSFISDGQLQAAKDAIAADTDIKVVTLDIGGNDLLKLLLDGTCPFGPDCTTEAEDALEAFGTNFAFILSKLAGPLFFDGGDEELMVMTYYNPLSGTGHPAEGFIDLALAGPDFITSCADLGISNPPGLNDIIDCAVTASASTFAAIGVTVKVVDVYPLFDGKATLLTHIAEFDTNPSLSIHPNNLGYNVITGAFVKAALQ